MRDSREQVEVVWHWSMDGSVWAPLSCCDGLVAVIVFGRTNLPPDAPRAWLFALSSDTGEPRWRVSLRNLPGCRRCGALVRESGIYVPEHNELLRIDRSSGLVGQRRPVTPGDIVTTPVSLDGLVLIATSGSRIHAIHASSLDLVWEHDIADGLIYGCACSRDRVYVAAPGRGADRGGILCLDRSTGRRLWGRPAEAAGDFYCHPPIIAGDLLLVPSGRGSRKLIALRLVDGVPVWRRELDRAGPALPVIDDLGATAAVEGDECFVASPDGGVYKVALPNGDILWRSALRGASEFGPSIAGEKVFIGTNSGDVHCIERRSGGELWRMPLGGMIRTTPCVSHGSAVVSAEIDGRVHVFALRFSD